MQVFAVSPADRDWKTAYPLLDGGGVSRYNKMIILTIPLEVRDPFWHADDATALL